MNRELLFRISAVMAFLGLATIFLADQYTEVPEREVSELGPDDMGENIVLEGEVTDSGVSGRTEFFTLRDENSTIQGVSFSRVGLERGDQVRVRGHVSMYHGELELIAEDVQK